MRETPALTVCDVFMQDGADVHVYDPKVQREEAIQELKYHGVEVDDNWLTFTKTVAIFRRGRGS